ncbi:helix-turn-helix protein [Stackebrandtia endophytica]|uniref:Helix-turn-helix protein n=1 Tax=Stackebrandtia endophytica TaxID=1496996 RepID=A0A543AVV7_9ACTN|nr:helix-turn-helix transcriptional regulator [Stackebrandtia endophytica]TQL76713.1 helix-turn-helix protein [Stackebrandtia endophytica]
MARREPTMRAVWLGRELQQMRLGAGLSAKQIGNSIGRDQSTVSRMEDGRTPVSERVLDRFLEECGVVDPDRLADMHCIRRDAANSGWWDGYEGEVAGVLMDHTWVESKAEIARTFDLAHVPGLLQTPEYAHGVMSAVDPSADLDRWIELRMTRQHVLTKHQPMNLTAIIDHSVIRRQVSSPDVMRSQLDHLLKVTQLGNVDIRILPMDHYCGVTGAFEVFTLLSPYPRVGYIAGTAGDVCIEGHAVERLSVQFDRLLSASVNADDSLDLIVKERNDL